ncbi:hypothetical protein L843_3412 [Mycobacterium intracellulare MIN_061107_1834]|nr:hypothetical protein L843_3412 [Mycobacterium intracellulare MIN_061107_1834]
MRPNQPTGRLSGTAGVTSRIPLRGGCARAVLAVAGHDVVDAGMVGM